MKFAIPGLDKLMRRKKGGGDEDEEEGYEDEAEADSADEEAESPAEREPAGESEEADDSVDEETEVAAGPPARRTEEDEDEEGEEHWQDADEGGRAKAIVANLLRFPATIGLAVLRMAGDGRRRLIVLGGAGFLGVLLVGIIAFLIFGGSSPPPPVAKTQGQGAAIEAPPPPQFGPGASEPTEPPAPRPGGEAQPPAQGEAPPPSAPPVEVTPPAPPPSTGITGLVIPSMPAEAFARLPELAAAEKPLVAQADPALLEKGPLGSVPKAGPGGRLPWQAYARPISPNDDRPRIAVIVKGLGLAQAATDAAIRRLPGAVTLALDPSGSNLDGVAAAARAAGHEVLMTLPLASEAFPLRDPGPFALPIVQMPADNLPRLKTIMGAATGYVGLMASMGGNLMGRDDQIRPILLELKSRGLMFVDGGGTAKSLAPGIASEIGLPRAIVKIVLDEDPSRTAIDAKLAETERLARNAAATVVLASPYPVTLERLAAWVKTLDGKQLSLMPITALADRQFE